VRYLLCFSAVFLIGLIAQAQAGYHILNYSGKDSQFFDSIHISSKNKSSFLVKSYEVFVEVIFDNCNNAHSIEILEVPGMSLSKAVDSYLTTIFSAANGKWTGTANQMGVLSVVYRVNLLPKHESFEQKKNRNDIIADYFIAPKENYTRVDKLAIRRDIRYLTFEF
jgi:hypothetical protein